MANFSLVQAHEYSFDVLFSNLQYRANTYQHFYVKLYRGGSVGENQYIGSTGEHSTSSTNYSYTLNVYGNRSFTFSPNTTYRLKGYARHTGADWLVGEITVTTKALPQPPSTPTGFYAFINGDGNLQITWNYVSGATSYNVYFNNSYYANTYSNYYVFTGLSDLTTYAFGVRGVNSNGLQGEPAKINYQTPDTTPPKMSSLTVSGNASSITAVFNATDSGVGVSGYYLHIGIKNGNSSTLVSKGVVYHSSNNRYTFTTDGNGYKFEVGATYTVGVIAFDKSGNNSSVMTKSIKITSTRPNNFSWTYAKNKGQNFILTATEWNSFTTRINDFRRYKGLTNYTFTNAVKGNDFTADMYNQTRNAIVNMPLSVSLPVYRNPKEDVLASDLNRLVSSLNSIT